MTVQFTSGSALPLSSVVESHRPLVDGSRSAAVRLRVAQGLLPSSFGDLVPTLTFLLADADESVRSAAKKTLHEAQEGEVERVLQQTEDAWLLDALSHRTFDDSVHLAIALNRHVRAETLAHLGARASHKACEVIGRNAQQALQHPAIIEALFFNPQAPQATVQGLLELAVREGLDLGHMPGYDEIRKDLMGISGSLKEAQTDAGLDDVTFLSVMGMMLDDEQDGVVGGEAFEEQEEANRSLQALIMSMSVAQKIRLALVGDANARKLLIRDPKKMVSLAVLKSPRLTDGEIRMYAANKNVADEVIATIARNRTWTRDYSVRKALVMNPKTPLSVAMGFMRTLIVKDIKSVSKSREVSGTVARSAKQLLTKLEQQRNRKKK